MQSYEIEIKSLLRTKENADQLKRRLKEKDPQMKLASSHSELNHYFTLPDTLDDLYKKIQSHIPDAELPALQKILTEGKKVSVRTRQARGKVLFVVKASIGDDTSANGVSRIEFESEVSIGLDELDSLLISAGLSYQAKWSRDREEYLSGDTHICIDRNAGYGYIAEFERVIDDPSKADKTKSELLNLMDELEVSELKQDRLERMFAHYNKHWGEYYGTEKTFIIE